MIIRQAFTLLRQNPFFSVVYSSYGYSYRKADHSNANTGMSYQAASRVFENLPGAELVTYTSYFTMEYCGVSPEKGSRRQKRRVALNFWRLYDIRFVAGR